MREGPVMARVAALMGDPARANMLTALLDARALTAGELARDAGVAPPTGSGHLARLADGGLVVVEKQGRHRYFRLAGSDVAAVIEGLMGLAQRTGAVRVRAGPRDNALRAARVCYDHLAGERAVAAADAMVARGLIGPGPALTSDGRTFFSAFGLDLPALERGRRPLCRACLDWSERRDHLAGALGAAMLDHVLAQGWASRGHGRVIEFSLAGARAFDRAFALDG
jgi:DNA-binding transcriptional ArsR family regulator